MPNDSLPLLAVSSKDSSNVFSKDFYRTFDVLKEGVQLIDFNGSHLYVNRAYADYVQCSKEDLIGVHYSKGFIDFEASVLGKSILKSLEDRKSRHFETDLILSDSTRVWFEIQIEPVIDGLLIVSLDITAQKKFKNSLEKVKRLYMFTSAIVQGITHFKEKQKYLEVICDVAVDIGMFKIAYFGKINPMRNLELICARGDEKGIRDILQFEGKNLDDPSLNEIPTVKVLRSGKYLFDNDIQKNTGMAKWKEIFSGHNIHSCIVLPIKKFGKVYGVMGLYSNQQNFFDEEEILQLKTATEDISYAIENFERTNQLESVKDLVVQNEKRFRTLIEKGADIKTLSSKDGKIIYVSPSVEMVLGYKKEEMIMLTGNDLIHPEDLGEYIKMRSCIIDVPSKSFTIQMRVRHKMGHWIWCECTVSNFLHEPSILALVSNFRDITESKNAQIQREFDKSNLDALINSTTDLMWSVDRDFNLIAFNSPFEKMVKQIFGASVQKGSSAMSNVFPVSELPRYKEYYQRAFNGETFTKVEHVKLPVELWAEISFNPIREGDKVVGTACHSRDITEKKRTIHQLRKSEAFNRGILRSLSSHIAVIDGLGKIIAVNEAWQRFARENGDSLLQFTGEGMNYLEVCRNSALQGDTMAAEVIQGILDVIEDKRPLFYLEYPCHTPQKLKWFAMRVLKFDGEETMVVITHQDITERKLSEEKLIEKNQELEKTNEELDRFVYSASHDLRAPLTSILGLVNLLESESKEACTLTYAEMIKRSIQRLDGFIKNIINYSKNNRQELLNERVDIATTLTDAIDALRYMEEFEKVTFEINIEGEKTFFSDNQRVKIIFENIISNAIKFIDSRKPVNYIKITGYCDAVGLNMSFEDNGIGIPLEHIDKIFQMFFRVSGKIQGAGIGLYIVKEALIRLEGEIHVESKEGFGTIFHIKIKNHTV